MSATSRRLSDALSASARSRAGSASITIAHHLQHRLNEAERASRSSVVDDEESDYKMLVYQFCVDAESLLIVIQRRRQLRQERRLAATAILGRVSVSTSLRSAFRAWSNFVFLSREQSIAQLSVLTQVSHRVQSQFFSRWRAAADLKALRRAVADIAEQHYSQTLTRRSFTRIVSASRRLKALRHAVVDSNGWRGSVLPLVSVCVQRRRLSGQRLEYNGEGEDKRQEEMGQMTSPSLEGEGASASGDSEGATSHPLSAFSESSPAGSSSTWRWSAHSRRGQRERMQSDMEADAHVGLVPPRQRASVDCSSSNSSCESNCSSSGDVLEDHTPHRGTKLSCRSVVSRMRQRAVLRLQDALSRPPAWATICLHPSCCHEGGITHVATAANGAATAVATFHTTEPLPTTASLDAATGLLSHSVDTLHPTVYAPFRHDSCSPAHAPSPSVASRPIVPTASATPTGLRLIPPAAPTHSPKGSSCCPECGMQWRWALRNSRRFHVKYHTTTPSLGTPENVFDSSPPTASRVMEWVLMPRLCVHGCATVRRHPQGMPSGALVSSKRSKATRPSEAAQNACGCRKGLAWASMLRIQDDDYPSFGLSIRRLEECLRRRLCMLRIVSEWRSAALCRVRERAADFVSRRKRLQHIWAVWVRNALRSVQSAVAAAEVAHGLDAAHSPQQIPLCQQWSSDHHPALSGRADISSCPNVKGAAAQPILKRLKSPLTDARWCVRLDGAPNRILHDRVNCFHSASHVHSTFLPAGTHYRIQCDAQLKHSLPGDEIRCTGEVSKGCHTWHPKEPSKVPSPQTVSSCGVGRDSIHAAQAPTRVTATEQVSTSVPQHVMVSSFFQRSPSKRNPLGDHAARWSAPSLRSSSEPLQAVPCHTLPSHQVQSLRASSACGARHNSAAEVLKAAAESACAARAEAIARAAHRAHTEALENAAETVACAVATSLRARVWTVWRAATTVRVHANRTTLKVGWMLWREAFRQRLRLQAAAVAQAAAATAVKQRVIEAKLHSLTASATAVVFGRQRRMLLAVWRQWRERTRLLSHFHTMTAAADQFLSQRLQRDAFRTLRRAACLASMARDAHRQVVLRAVWSRWTERMRLQQLERTARMVVAFRRWRRVTRATQCAAESGCRLLQLRAVWLRWRNALREVRDAQHRVVALTQLRDRSCIQVHWARWVAAARAAHQRRHAVAFRMDCFRTMRAAFATWRGRLLQISAASDNANRLLLVQTFERWKLRAAHALQQQRLLAKADQHYVSVCLRMPHRVVSWDRARSLAAMSRSSSPPTDLDQTPPCSAHLHQGETPPAGAAAAAAVAVHRVDTAVARWFIANLRKEVSQQRSAVRLADSLWRRSTLLRLWRRWVAQKEAVAQDALQLHYAAQIAAAERLTAALKMEYGMPF